MDHGRNHTMQPAGRQKVCFFPLTQQHDPPCQRLSCRAKAPEPSHMSPCPRRRSARRALKDTGHGEWTCSNRQPNRKQCDQDHAPAMAAFRSSTASVNTGSLLVILPHSQASGVQTQYWNKKEGCTLVRRCNARAGKRGGQQKRGPAKKGTGKKVEPERHPEPRQYRVNGVGAFDACKNALVKVLRRGARRPLAGGKGKVRHLLGIVFRFGLCAPCRSADGEVVLVGRAVVCAETGPVACGDWTLGRQRQRFCFQTRQRSEARQSYRWAGCRSARAHTLRRGQNRIQQAEARPSADCPANATKRARD